MRITFCCIVDEARRFQEEFQQWVIAHRFYSGSEITLKAYFIDVIPEHLKSFLVKNRVIGKTVMQLVPGSPHCNKIIPFLDEQNVSEFDVIVVTDSDHHVVHDLSEYCREDVIRLAPNNGNNPPLSKFIDLFTHFGIKTAVRSGTSLMPDEHGSKETYLNNNSGGIIMMPSFLSKKVAIEWKMWANKLVANRELLGRWSIHVDQVAFAFTMESLGMDIDFLPAETNAVLKMIPQLTDIKAFHITKSHRLLFAKWFDEDNRLQITSDNPELIAAIENYNKIVETYNKTKLKYAS